MDNEKFGLKPDKLQPDAEAVLGINSQVVALAPALDAVGKEEGGGAIQIVDPDGQQHQGRRLRQCQVAVRSPPMMRGETTNG